MNKNLLSFLIACFLSFTALAQTPETEPNNNSTASGVQVITANGSFNGSFSTSDLEYYRIAPNTGGTITVTFTNAPAANGIWLAPYPSGSNLVSTSNPGTFTYALNPALNYMLYTGTGMATGSWKFTVSGLSFVSTSITGSGVLCNGESTGAATVTASGTSPFTYSWSPAGGTSSVATGLSAGIYSVLVTNGDGIPATATINIGQPLALGTNTAITPPACYAGFGSATLTASGGTAPYDYLWSNSQMGPNGAFMYAGVYTATITDAHNCGMTKTLTVTEPSPIYYTFSSSGIACHGGTGTSGVVASGGSGSYTYSWSTGATTQSVSNLGPGTHSVTVTDTYGCAALMSSVFTDPPALTTATNAVNATCINMGSATVTASGGTTPYTYSWTSGSTSSITSLNAGTYTITVKDINDCTSSNTVIITQAPALTLTATASSASVCAGQPATLTANTGGGTGPVTYTWIAGPTTHSYEVNPSVTTTYTVNASDINGCTATGSISVLANQLPTLTVSGASICPGASFAIVPSGAASYTITGNTFSVSPGSTTSYSVTGTSAAGCAASNTAVAIVFVKTTPTLSVNNATICSGGSVAIIPSGATSYTISGNAFTVTPNTTTSYSVTGSNAGCAASNTAIATISVNASPTLSVNNATICSGSSVTLTPSGAVSYTITGNTFTVTPGTSTSYSVTGTAANGCSSSNTAIATVSVNASPTLMVNSTAICSGSSITISPSGADTYTISGGNFTVTPTTSTSYSITGTGLNGCAASNTAVSTVSVNTSPTITVNNSTICSGSSVTIIPSGAATYSISGGNFTVTPVTTTLYTVTATGANGCAASNTAVTTVAVNATPTISVNSATICSGSSATITPAGAATYTISGGNFIVSPTSNASYAVTGSSTAGCISSQVTSTISVNTLPVITAASSNPTVCVGQNATLTANGALTYSWSSSQTTPQIVISSSLALSTTYTVTGTDAHGCLNTGTVMQVTDLCTGLTNTAGNSSSVSLFPNPSNGLFTALFDFNGSKQIMILDETGRMIMTLVTENQSQVIDLSTYAKGIYFVKLSSGLITKNLKIVVQ